MNENERLIIAAFNDRELDASQNERVRQLIENDPEARRYLDELRRIDERLRSAFAASADEPVPPHFHAMLRKTSRKRLGHYVAPVALAASLALVAVLVIRQDAADELMREQLQHMRLEIASLRNQTLENVPSGAAASWVAPASASRAGIARAQVKPLKTYRTEDNRFCREYEERVEDAYGIEVRRGIACRTGKADWSDLITQSGSKGEAGPIDRRPVETSF